ncbi:phosphoglycerate kinase [Candidatus Dojkabacteria bacterium]|nr:phosphoglycerate kinase [Candidatus Dojkabacteria bacterium]
MYKRENLDNLLNKANYQNADLSNSKVLVRACLNVKIKDGVIKDRTRLDSALPLIKELAEKSKRVVIMAHLGRPEGRDSKFSFELVRKAMEDNLGEQVTMLEYLDDDINKLSEDYQKDRRVFLLENIRFFEGEQSKDEEERNEFSRKLSGLGEVFINDAFPDYRPAPSTVGVVEYLPSYIGPAFMNDVKALSKFGDPERPYIAVVGGSKLSEKVDVIDSLVEYTDKVLVGGALVYTLLKSIGIEVGNSLIEEDKLHIAEEIMREHKDKILLPVDHVVVEEFEEPEDESGYKIIDDQAIPEDKTAVDIGPQTLKIYKEKIRQAKSVMWNGPMGVFEWKIAGRGTQEIGRTIAKNKEAFTLIGGGDCIASVHKYGIEGFDYISNGGGAMLSFFSYDDFEILDVILDKFEK